jgi:hypothetical protein
MFVLRKQNIEILYNTEKQREVLGDDVGVTGPLE